jgi:hypothetical protein
MKLKKLMPAMRYNGMSNRTLPEVVVSARRTANHRATHTIAIMHVHALCCCHTIENKPPINLLIEVVPP